MSLSYTSYLGELTARAYFEFLGNSKALCKALRGLDTTLSCRWRWVWSNLMGLGFLENECVAIQAKRLFIFP